MSEHSKIPPSSLHRVVKCPASLIANAADNTTSDAAEEGTTAHWVAEQMLNGELVNVGDICPETNMAVDADMIVHVTEYVNHVDGDLRFIESKLVIPQIHASCWGTVDHAAMIGGVLTVTDLKYGRRVVEPLNNPQLMAYAMGVANRLEIIDPETPVVLEIFQPRAWHSLGPARQWHTTLGEIDKRIVVIAEAVREGLSDTPSAKSGDHCMYCVKASTCGALTTAADNAIDVIMSHVENEECSINYAAMQLEALEHADKILGIKKTAITEKILGEISKGVNVPGYSMVPTFSRKTWSKPDDEIKTLGELMGTPLTESKLMTPAAAIKAGVSKDTVNKLSVSNKTGVKLKRDNNSLAQMIFSKKV